MIRWKICWIKLLKRSWEEIGISAQVWFEAFNGPCLAEFKQWPSGQMMMNLVPIFRSLRLGARHAYKCVYPEKFKFGHYYSSFHESVWISALFIKADLHKQKTKCWYVQQSICEPPEWKGFLLCAPLFRTIFRDKKFPDVLTSRKSTNFLLLVEEFELIQQCNYHIIFQKKSETKISSNHCKKINDYMKDFLPSISDCRSLYRLGNLGIFQYVIWSLWIPSGVIGWRLQKIH